MSNPQLCHRRTVRWLVLTTKLNCMERKPRALACCRECVHMARATPWLNDNYDVFSRREQVCSRRNVDRRDPGANQSGPEMGVGVRKMTPPQAPEFSGRCPLACRHILGARFGKRRHICGWRPSDVRAVSEANRRLRYLLHGNFWAIARLAVWLTPVMAFRNSLIVGPLPSCGHEGGRKNFSFCERRR